MYEYRKFRKNKVVDGIKDVDVVVFVWNDDYQ